MRSNSTKHQHKGGSGQGAAEEGMPNHYPRLYLMAAVSFAAMFVLMYAMVDRFSNVFVNLNQAYMAGLMAAPMVIIEVLFMGSMYPDKRKNAVVLVISLIAGVLFWILIRQQSAIDNAQFLRSMIPHHAGAVLMCENSRADDAEIQKLCAEIVKSQKAEILQMQRKLEQLD